MTLRKVLKSKLHRATVTEANLQYEGSCTVDENLMDKADIAHHEMVLISNLNNGERFETYVIPGERGSGKICLNGAAARKGLVGDKVIIITTRYITDDVTNDYKPTIIILSEDNKPTN